MEIENYNTQSVGIGSNDLFFSMSVRSLCVCARAVQISCVNVLPELVYKHVVSLPPMRVKVSAK